MVWEGDRYCDPSCATALTCESLSVSQRVIAPEDLPVILTLTTTKDGQYIMEEDIKEINYGADLNSASLTDGNLTTTWTIPAGTAVGEYHAWADIVWGSVEGNVHAGCTDYDECTSGSERCQLAIAIQGAPPEAECWDECNNNEECPLDFECINSRCANAECPEEQDCICPVEPPTTGLSDNTVKAALLALLLIILGMWGFKNQEMVGVIIDKGLGVWPLPIVLDRVRYGKKERFERDALKDVESNRNKR